MAATSGHTDPLSSHEQIESIIINFSQNLKNAFLASVKQGILEVTNNSKDHDGNEKTKKRHASIDENKRAKRKCNEVKVSEKHIEEDHNRIVPERNQRGHSENGKKTIEKTTFTSIESCNKAQVRNESSDTCIRNRKTTDVKKAREVSSKDIQLKYSCSFCTERFPSLTTVRDHIWTKHKEENRLRKEGKYTNSNEFHSPRKEDSKVEPKAKEKLPPSEETKSLLLYLCKACKFASISYDCMIEHCQDHIIDKEEPGHYLNSHKSKRYIKITILGQKYYVDLLTYNVTDDIRESEVIQIQCDYKLLKNDMWPGIFDTFSKPEIDRINGASIYNFTRVIRLSSNNKTSSAPFMLYQCKRCMTHVDPHSIVSHVQQNSCHEKCNSFPCYDCRKSFFSESAMYLHYKTHKVTDSDKKYKTILFNDDKDFHTNSLILKAAGIQINYAATGKYAEHQKNSELASHEHVKEKTCSQSMNDARAMIIQGTQTESRNNTSKSKNIIDSESKTNNDKTVKETTADIYKCQCGLCFHNLESLFKHLENCHYDTVLRKCTCECGLEFDETQYSSHYQHSQGFTKFNVKKVTISDEQTIDLKNMQHKIKNNEPQSNITEEITIRNKDRDNHGGKISGNEIKSKRDEDKQLCEKTQLNETQCNSSELSMSSTVNTVAVCPKQDDLSNISTSKCVEKSPKVIHNNPRGIGAEVSVHIEAGETISVSPNISEIENEIIAEVTDGGQDLSSKSHGQHELSNREADNKNENQLMVDTTMEIELRERNINKQATEVDLKNNTCITNTDIKKSNYPILTQDKEDIKTLENEQQNRLGVNTNQTKEVITTQNVNQEIIENLTMETVQRHVDTAKSKQQDEENKIYTEDELLKDADASAYFDIDESLLTDDEDP